MMYVYLPLRPGIYRDRTSRDIYRVRLTRDRLRVYTERWTRVAAEPAPPRYQFLYAPEALEHLHADDRIPLDEARQISREVGQCLACADILTDPKSQAAGMGPKCAESWNYDDPKSRFVYGLTAAQIREHRERTARESVRATVIDRDGCVVLESDPHPAIKSVMESVAAEWHGWSQWSFQRDRLDEVIEALDVLRFRIDDLVAIREGWLTAVAPTG